MVTQLQRPVEDDNITTDRFGRFDKYQNTGVVVGGAWHRSTIEWDELAIASAFRAHFDRGLPWQDTGFPTTVVEGDGDWQSRWAGSRWEKCATVDEVLSKLQTYDDLYETIRAEGYRQSPLLDELTLNIGPDGGLIHNNSASHRLAIAKLLDIDMIPAHVHVRHRDWQHHRNQLRDGQVTDDTAHPDLEDIQQ